MICITLIFELLKKSYLFIWGILSLLLLGRHSNLAKENEKLKHMIDENERTIKIQSKVLHAVQNSKPANLNANIERMRQNKL